MMNLVDFRRLSILFAILFGILLLASCASTYYGTLEKFGVEKRDILIDRIEETQAAQESAKKQFNSALEQYRSVVNVDGGELEDVYDRLNTEYKRSQRRANTVRERIDAVESVAGDLFEEWEEELNSYSDQKLRQRSQRLLSDTQGEYGRLLSAMERAERSMEPVLTLFSDQVLFLRHNLNARAIGALEAELSGIERATAAVIADMERSISEANRFIELMK